MNQISSVKDQNKPKIKKKWLKITLIVIGILFLIGGVMLWKAGMTLNKITDGGFMKSIAKSMPGVSQKLKGEEEGRINVLLLAMRGANVPGGGLLADTIMVVSIKPLENKISMVSIPRDLWTNNPGWGNQSKINAVFAAGEENDKKQGMEDMKKVVGEVAGLPIHYAVTTNFKGFTELVDILGGIDVDLPEAFTEPLQFQEAHVCDPNVFTVPTGKYEIKRDSRKYGKIVAQYPLCTNPDVECGGAFSLPAGKSTLDGEKALCYVRSRVTSNDFQRARRQQDVLKQIKEKALSVGTLSDFGKINSILQSLGENMRTDMEAWELKAFYDLYGKLQNPTINQKVLENSEEGLLYAPEVTKERGYILLPIGDNYDRVHQLFQTII